VSTEETKENKKATGNWQIDQPWLPFLFVLVGLPGLFLTLISVLYLTGYVLEGNSALTYIGYLNIRPAEYGFTPMMTIVALIIVGVVGSVCILIGTGKIKQWGYIYVFLSFGLAPLIADYFASKRTGPPRFKGDDDLLIYLIIVPITVFYLVKSYYKKRNNSNKKR
jgi:hypothetical protein